MYEPLARPDYYGASAPSRPSTDDASIPPTQMASGPQERSGMVPVFTETRSIGLAPAPAPAASPRLRRRPSPWPPRRRNQPAPELTPPRGGGHALPPGPYPPDLSRWNSYGALKH